MKIKEIYIKDFRQFKDFTLNLTYPAGHAKAGEPLEKVCFIGQSGTGKTTLLKIMYMMRIPMDWKEKLSASSFELINQVAFTATNKNNDEIKAAFKENATDKYALSESMWTEFFDSKYSYSEILSPLGNISDKQLNAAKFLQNSLNLNEKIIYFPSNLKYDLKKEFKTNLKQFNPKKAFDFSKDNISQLWDIIAEDIKKHHETLLAIRQDISFAAESGDISLIESKVIKLKEWEVNNYNPVKKLAENCINPLISHFKLRVKEDFSFEQKEDIGFIKLETFEGIEVPNESWSTGTQQIILSALPLYLLSPEDSTILFDEPESSLYPDLQRVIINYYQNLTKDSQFFYATHSPIIASSFEPWEIVELKFDDNGHVYREKYYEGENHVNNYYIDPRYLTFDLMLKKVFDMKYTNGDMRYEALSEYEMLKNQLDKLKKEEKLQTTEAKEIYARFKTLSQKLAANPA
jgi:ABC-type lipoprotein export system ATPase subunit